MRIVIIGQAPFGAKVLEGLLSKGEEIVAAYTPPEQAGGRPDPLREAAQSKNIPVFQPDSYKDDQVFAEYQDLKPDLTILAFVTDIIPARFFDVPTHGAICYHPSILPRHRGASAINWAIMMGDDRTGLTVFWPDHGIDTGPILLQKEVEIGAGDTTGSLYFNHLFPLGVEAVLESVDLIRDGKAPGIIQSEEGATYEALCDDRVGEVDWTKPARDVYNHIRGCDPQPSAFSFLNGEKVRFYGAKLLAESGDESAGTVQQIGSDGIRLALNGGAILIAKVRGHTGGKIGAEEFASEKNLKTGDRFSAN
ncbi:MAG: methionyl-tRNA formyltransferase [Deltaproteobacteria bacterium]|nr:methionyl-tRNA formyltransferase [Deltaproteobacteria bacterium]